VKVVSVGRDIRGKSPALHIDPCRSLASKLTKVRRNKVRLGTAADIGTLMVVMVEGQKLSVSREYKDYNDLYLHLLVLCAPVPPQAYPGCSLPGGRGCGVIMRFSVY